MLTLHPSDSHITGDGDAQARDEDVFSNDYGSEKEHMKMVRLFFSIFDVFDSGYIAYKEYQMVISSLLQGDPELNQSLAHSLEAEKEAHSQNTGVHQSDVSLDISTANEVEHNWRNLHVDEGLISDIFKYMDTDGDGKVSISDFEKFFHNLVLK